MLPLWKPIGGTKKSHKHDDGPKSKEELIIEREKLVKKIHKILEGVKSAEDFFRYEEINRKLNKQVRELNEKIDSLT